MWRVINRRTEIGRECTVANEDAKFGANPRRGEQERQDICFFAGYISDGDRTEIQAGRLPAYVAGPTVYRVWCCSRGGRRNFWRGEATRGGSYTCEVARKRLTDMLATVPRAKWPHRIGPEMLTHRNSQTAKAYSCFCVGPLPMFCKVSRPAIGQQFCTRLNVAIVLGRNCLFAFFF